jgi:hypothetical protein
MRIYSAHSLRSLLISRVVMGFGGGVFLVRAVIWSEPQNWDTEIRKLGA